MNSKDPKILPFHLLHETRQNDYLSRAQELVNHGIAEKLYILDEKMKLMVDKHH
jgi:hypothetical protein